MAGPDGGPSLLRQVIDGRLVGGSYRHKEKKAIRARRRRKKELDGDGVLRFTPFIFTLLILHKETSCGSLQGRGEGGDELVFVVYGGPDLGLISQI